MTEGFIYRRGSSISILFIWTCSFPLFFFFVFDLVKAQQEGLRNVSIANTSPEITYSPFLCNSSSSEPDCNGGWRVLDVEGVTVVSTDGSVVDGVDIVPQVFFRFRAQNLTMTTSSLSNASINVTVVTGKTILNAVGNSSVGSFAVVHLQDTETTTLEVTYIQGTIPSRLDIGNITITVKNDSVSTSFLPTQTLPPSISLPSIVPTTTASSSSSSATATNSGESDSKNKLIANAVGLTIGLGLGLTAATCAIYVLWRRRRGPKGEHASGASGASMEDWNRDQHPSLVGRQSLSSYRSPRATKDYTDTRWFYR
ncbi:hypothetical protein L218DRAFT_766499 [Marasmius fiardii PR-910]|nr:hypothetical protein L218DRAFT_766499 [Marasmius fiardii PR-910]